ncbi:MAG: hypothetical protein LAT66_07485 [Alkalimonas sp.]|nr:hypothetical protein [Alkalimonas sp.]
MLARKTSGLFASGGIDYHTIKDKTEQNYKKFSFKKTGLRIDWYKPVWVPAGDYFWRLS